MATNPRLPSDPQDSSNRKPQIVPPGPARKTPGAGPGVVFALIVAAALFAAIAYYMPRAPHKSPAPTGSQAPPQPTSNQLQFSNVNLRLGPAGSEVSLQGMVMNAGNRPILGSTVQLNFMDNTGKVVATVVKPLQGMAEQNGVLQSDDFGTNPLKPNQTRAFQVVVSPVPKGWNHTLPNMTVLTVSAAG